VVPAESPLPGSNVSAVLSRPEYLVIQELYRRSRGSSELELAKRTQLAVATLNVVLPKLERRRLIECHDNAWRLTGRGRLQVRQSQAQAT